jgi:hypothetical protein
LRLWAAAGGRAVEVVAGGSETEGLPGTGQRPLRTALELFPCRSRGEDDAFRESEREDVIYINSRRRRQVQIGPADGHHPDESLESWIGIYDLFA